VSFIIGISIYIYIVASGKLSTYTNQIDVIQLTNYRLNQLDSMVSSLLNLVALQQNLTSLNY